MLLCLYECSFMFICLFIWMESNFEFCGQYIQWIDLLLKVTIWLERLLKKLWLVVKPRTKKNQKIGKSLFFVANLSKKKCM
ncbi:unnamed protein product [Blepharisma stoltei]|uniref:Uncharacterized protein n=1 Tax=Blepharisma stoltei TaxID=1481888 RepID=A0AAU9JQC2_9CILI|nr:unnamed protein product [Blepharisma stoltei]